jgi:hypothetical protein
MSPTATQKTAQLNDFDLYCFCREIADMVCEILERHGIPFEDRRSSLCSADGAQTANGFFIEEYQGVVQSLWSPWGHWQFIGSSSGSAPAWEAAWAEIRQLFGATLYKPMERVAGVGPVGPIFAISRIGDKPLPAAVALDKTGFDRPTTIWEAWRDLTARYQSTKG